jgi:chromate transporter
MLPKHESQLQEVILLFTRLGFTAFGGPAAHIAMMHDEVVRKRRWLSDEQFLDLVGATNLIPGPNSTEMTIHLGYLRAGWRGLIAAGVSFITPAMLIVLGLAWVYVRFGETPQAEWLLYGIKPVIIAIIIQALWALGQKAVKNPLTALAAAGVAVLFFLSVNELALLFGAGLLVMFGMNLNRSSSQFIKSLLPLSGLGPVAQTLAQVALQTAQPFSQLALFLTFLKIGSVLYGSGYVLLAFLRADFVVHFGWLTDQLLIDAIAIGQVTPGPVFTTATFIGYLLGGLPGGLLATLGIFLPSFLFVALSNPLIPRLRRSRWFGALLDGVNAASLGLMAAVTWQLGRASLIDALTIIIALLALILLLRFKINTTWLVLAGALVGLVKMMLG